MFFFWKKNFVNRFVLRVPKSELQERNGSFLIFFFFKKHFVNRFVLRVPKSELQETQRFIFEKLYFKKNPATSIFFFLFKF